MHIHVPKPLHGWQALLNEILVIVIGILIALAFEQAVEQMHWRHKVEDGEERLKTETVNNVFVAAETVSVSNCEMAILNRMRTAITTSGARPVTLPVYATPSDIGLTAQGDRGNVLPFVPRLYSSSIWTSLVQDGTSTHMEPARQRSLGAIYGQVIRLDEMSRAMRISQGELSPLGDGLVLDAASRLSLAQAVGRAETQLRYKLLMAEQVILSLRRQKLEPTREETDKRLKLTTERMYGKLCRDVGAPLIDWYDAIKPYETAPELVKK